MIYFATQRQVLSASLNPMCMRGVCAWSRSVFQESYWILIRNILQARPPSATAGSLDRLAFASHNNSWTVYSSTVNLPAVLNDPKKGMYSRIHF